MKNALNTKLFPKQQKKDGIMTKWLFSDRGKTYGPYELTNALKFLQNNPKSYAWQPEYSQWLLASEIADFKQEATPPPPPIDIDPEFFELFADKEKQLIQELERIDASLQTSMSSLPEINADIAAQTTNAIGLCTEVESTVLKVEQQMKALQQNLEGLVS